MVLWLLLILVDKVAYWLDQRFGTSFVKPKVTVKEIEQLITAEVLIGSSSREVVGFLIAHNISCRGEIYDNLEENSHFQHPKLTVSRSHIKRYLSAWIPDVGGDLLYRWDICVNFYFDAEDRLIEYLVEEVGSGP
jgi:hypothetical protein